MVLKSLQYFGVVQFLISLLCILQHIVSCLSLERLLARNYSDLHIQPCKFTGKYQSSEIGP